MNFIIGKKQLSGIRGAVAAFSLILAWSGAAKAQNQVEPVIDYSHPNITVDLSVISDGGYIRSTNAATPDLRPLLDRQLLMPGGQRPASMLHVPAPSGKALPKLKKPKKIRTAAKAPPKQAPVIKKVVKAAPVIAKAPDKKAPPAAATFAPAKPVKTAAAPKKLKAPVKPAKPAVTVKAETKAPTPPPPPKTNKAATTEQAALPPANAAIEDDGAIRIVFNPDQTKLPADAKGKLTMLAQSMKNRDNKRLQLMAYAGGQALSSSLARRMSLSRALSIRSFLIENGVRSTRIDVRALGNKTTEEPVNRVDLNITER